MARVNNGGTNIHSGQMNAGNSEFQSSTNLRRGVKKTGWKHERDFGPKQPAPMTGMRGSQMGSHPRKRVDVMDKHMDREYGTTPKLGNTCGPQK